MSLRALKDLPRHSQDDDEDSGRPFDLAGEPEDFERTSLECVVYFNPNHAIANELEQFRGRLLAEIAPRYRSFEFHGLSEDDLRRASPFSTQVRESLFLRDGFARGRGLWLVPEPEQPPRAGRKADHLSREESQEALQILALMTERVLRASRRLTAHIRRSTWLDADIDAILAPVCGRVSMTAQDNAAAREKAADRGDAKRVVAPIIPIVREDGLLFGCTNFEKRRTVIPSYASAPNSAMREGSRALKDWSDAGRCDLHTDTATKQINRELGNLIQHFGVDFDLAGAALWMCQCVMQMRLSAEIVQRRTAASWFKHEDKKEALAFEDQLLSQQLSKAYGQLAGRSKIDPFPPSPARRALAAFYGIAFEPWGDGDPEDRDGRALRNVLFFVRWIGQLRLTGRASLDRSLAYNIRNIVEQNDPDVIELFSGPEGQELEKLLGDMLLITGWQTLYDAACALLNRQIDEVYTVTYSWQGLAEDGPHADFDQNERRLDIVGPLLMLPLHAADYWRDKARQISREGLYAYVE